MIIKFKISYSLIKLFQLILFILCIFIVPVATNSAELLQINDPNTILVGDQNRSLYLSLYCIDINENDKVLATEVLKKNFPRGTKVKIKPYKFSDNRLLAKIYRIDDKTEMTDLLTSFNSANKDCMN
tara:strand:- start:411 stop:791 length:381 start_codon:yes stop_codon:yes gene_type:complete